MTSGQLQEVPSAGGVLDLESGRTLIVGSGEMEATVTAPVPSKVETTTVEVSEPEVKVSAEEVAVAEPVVETAASDVTTGAQVPAAPEFAVEAPSTEVSAADAATAAVEAGLGDADVAAAPPAPVAPEFEVAPASVDISAPEVDVRASGPAVPEAEIGAPAIEASTPDVTAAAPKVEATAPAIDASLPEMTAAAPTVDASAPSLEASLPQVTPTAPEIEGKTPAIESSVPDMTAAVPAVAAPTVDVDAPDVSASAPDVAVAAPTVDIDAPAVEASVPDVAVTAPKVDVGAPAVEASVPDVAAAAPQVAAPTIDVGVPSVGASVPSTVPAATGISKVSDSRMNSGVEEETEAGKITDAVKATEASKVTDAVTDAVNETEASKVTDVVTDAVKLSPPTEPAGSSVASKIEKFSSDVVVTEASPLIAPEAATKSTSLVVADGVDVSALKKTTQVEELAKAVSALPDPLTLFLGEFLFVLLLNVIYAPLLKSWLLRLLIPPLLLATAASAAFWRTKHETSEANLQKLNDEERRKVAEFEQQLQERAQGLKDREKALIAEEEKLRAVRDKLQARIGMARTTDTRAAPEAMERGLTLTDNNKIELPGQPQNQTASMAEPPALADLTIKLDKNMKQLGQHAYETFAERAEVLKARSVLGFDSNTQEMSKEQLRERSKAQSQGIFMSFVGQIRPQAVPSQLPRPNKKLLTVKRMEDFTASADQTRLADG